MIVMLLGIVLSILMLSGFLLIAVIGVASVIALVQAIREIREESRIEAEKVAENTEEELNDF